MKCILDVPCTAGLSSLGDSAQAFPDMVLSRWPAHCPAYSTGLRAHLKRPYKKKSMKADLKYSWLMHIPWKC